MVSHMHTTTRLQRWISTKLIERGHPPLPMMVADLRAQEKSWRDCAATITDITGETVTSTSLWHWFGDDQGRAA